MAEKITRETTVSLAELAVVLGLTSKRIRQMVEEGIMSTSGKNAYPLAECVQNYSKFLRQQMPSKEDVKIEQSRRKAEVTMKVSKAEIVRLELQELKGKMHRAEDIEAITEDLVYAIRGALLAIPGRLAVDVVGVESAAEASEIIRAEIYKVMEELSRYEYDPARYEERVRARRDWAERDGEDDE